jgi:hypothetical protein
MKRHVTRPHSWNDYLTLTLTTIIRRVIKIISMRMCVWGGACSGLEPWTAGKHEHRAANIWIQTSSEDMVRWYDA